MCLPVAGIVSGGYWLLVTCLRHDWLDIVVWDDLVRLLWVTLILGVICVNL
jgi:hypothetical protein